MFKTPVIWSSFLVIVIAGLVANTVRMHFEFSKMARARGALFRKVGLLHVQMMDRILSKQEGQELDKLISNPDEWLSPLKDIINRDPKLASFIKAVAISSFDSNGEEVYTLFCNPIDDNVEAYESFTFSFKGESCTEIKRKALYFW